MSSVTLTFWRGLNIRRRTQLSGEMPSATGSFALPAYLMRSTVWGFILIASKRKPCSFKATRPWTSFRGKTLPAAKQSNASKREDARLLFVLRATQGGMRSAFYLRRKLEVILRRGGAFVDWRCARETRFASWEVPTGKSMLPWTTSRLASHRTEVIPYERGSGILMRDRSLKCAQHLRGSIQ